MNEFAERRAGLREFEGLFHAAILTQVRCISRCIASEASRDILLKEEAQTPGVLGFGLALYIARYTCIAVGEVVWNWYEHGDWSTAYLYIRRCIKFDQVNRPRSVEMLWALCGERGKPGVGFP